MRPGSSLAAGVLCLVVAGRAAAMSCYSPGWDDAGIHSPLVGYADDVPEVPVDARPWRVDDCYLDGSAMVPACVFVRTDEPDAAEIAVTDEVLGVEVCDGDERATYIRRFTATAPLSPGATYAVQCEDQSAHGEFTVRGDAAAAAAPEALVVEDVHFARGDDGGCCGSRGDALELHIADTDAAYLREGGYIEVVYADGSVHALVRPDNGVFYALPPTHGPIAVTPIGADGTRGDTVEIDDIDSDGVYLPCKLAGGRSSDALWVLAPLAWTLAQARRRRSS